MLFDGITYETMSKKTGISSQLLEYWDNKYRYILIDEFEKGWQIEGKRKLRKKQDGIDTEQVLEGMNRRKWKNANYNLILVENG